MIFARWDSHKIGNKTRWHIIDEDMIPLCGCPYPVKMSALGTEQTSEIPPIRLTCENCVYLLWKLVSHED